MSTGRFRSFAGAGWWSSAAVAWRSRTARRWPRWRTSRTGTCTCRRGRRRRPEGEGAGRRRATLAWVVGRGAWPPGSRPEPGPAEVGRGVLGREVLEGRRRPCERAGQVERLAERDQDVGGRVVEARRLHGLEPGLDDLDVERGLG